LGRYSAAEEAALVVVAAIFVFRRRSGAVVAFVVIWGRCGPGFEIVVCVVYLRVSGVAVGGELG